MVSNIPYHYQHSIAHDCCRGVSHWINLSAAQQYLDGDYLCGVTLALLLSFRNNGRIGCESNNVLEVHFQYDTLARCVSLSQCTHFPNQCHLSSSTVILILKLGLPLSQDIWSTLWFCIVVAHSCFPHTRCKNCFELCLLPLRVCPWLAMLHTL